MSAHHINPDPEPGTAIWQVFIGVAPKVIAIELLVRTKEWVKTDAPMIPADTGFFVGAASLLP